MATGFLLFLLSALSSWSGTFGGVSTSTENVAVDPGNTAELLCSYTSDFTNPRIEWKFIKDGSESFVYLDKQLTDSYKNRAEFFNTGIRLNAVTSSDNGTYTCEVVKITPPSLSGKATIFLLVRVPPSEPTIGVPTSVTTGSKAELTCTETNGSPPSIYKWYKNGILIPENPKSSPVFQNSSYALNTITGTLTFDSVSKDDAGEYYCTAGNGIGTNAEVASNAMRMEINDVNVGAIVAAVIVVALILALLGIGIWFLYSRGYFRRDTSSGKKVIYSLPSETRSDRNFQQTSSFLV